MLTWTQHFVEREGRREEEKEKREGGREGEGRKRGDLGDLGDGELKQTPNTSVVNINDTQCNVFPQSKLMPGKSIKNKLLMF